MRKVFPYLISLILSTLSLVSEPEMIRAESAIPNPYVPCENIRNEEYHSLRPYQASPCVTQVSNTALFCGNDLVLRDEITVGPGDAEKCDNNGDGSQTCTFKIQGKTRRIEVKLSDAELPIMGNTENVINSQQMSNISEEERLNEYVSWYINGTTNRAEYSFLDPQDPDNLDRVINFSGPTKKLLPKEIQYQSRTDTVLNAKDTRHDQKIGCVNLTGEIVQCYPDRAGVHALRLSDWEKHLPPKREDYDNFNEYWLDYKRWRGESCIKLPLVGISICIDNPLKPNYWGNLFSYIPFSSTEDRKGQAQVSTPTVLPENDDVKISEITFKDQSPAELFFPHMEETVQTVKLLQQTYASKGYEEELAIDSSVIHKGSNHCDLAEVRTNPGDHIAFENTDNLISGNLSYTAEFSCDFPLPGGPQPPPNICDNFGNDWSCYPKEGWTCEEEYTSSSLCRYDNDYKCGLNCEPLVQPTCTQIALVNLQVKTKTPLVDEAWKRTVAGAQSIFKRLFPKIGKGGPVISLIDIPGATKVQYTSTDGTPVLAGNPGNQRDGTSAELYFPHVGGISEYFLKGIQTLIRPKGYGEKITFGTVAGPSMGELPGYCGENPYPAQEPYPEERQASCELGVGWCSPEVIKNYLDSGMPYSYAENLSKICNLESGGWTNAFNDGCMCGGTLDYSVGLFQVNQIVHCDGAFSDYSWNPVSCTLSDASKLQACTNDYLDPETNIRYAVQLVNSPNSWCHWKTNSLNCGIVSSCP